MDLGLDFKLRSWNWSWNLRSWSWSWYYGDWPELELELKPPELELGLIFWRLARVGVETSGGGWEVSWYYGVDPNPVPQPPQKSLSPTPTITGTNILCHAFKSSLIWRLVTRGWNLLKSNRQVSGQITRKNSPSNGCRVTCPAWEPPAIPVTLVIENGNNFWSQGPGTKSAQNKGNYRNYHFAIHRLPRIPECTAANICCLLVPLPSQAPVPLTIFRSNSKFDQIGSVLVSNILNRSQRNFAHVTTVTLSWHVQNFVVVGGVHFKLEHCKFWSNFEFDRNIVSGTGARRWLSSHFANITANLYRMLFNIP